MELEQIPAILLSEIETSISKYIHGEVEPANLTPIYIEKKPSSKQAPKSRLIMEPFVELDASGECPGGTYFYLSDVDKVIQTLDYYAYNNAWAAIDLETSGTDPFSDIIFLCSMSVKPKEAIVFDMRECMKSPLFAPIFRGFLTSCHLVAHNALFEASFFLAKFGVMGQWGFDTLIGNQILNAGLPDRNGLGFVISKYYGVENLDKTYQKYFLKIHPDSPIRNEAIRYSAGDVCYLLDLAKKIESDLRKEEMWAVWEEIEQPFLEEVVRAKIHGVELDIPLLEELRDLVSAEVETTRKKFADIVGYQTIVKKNKPDEVVPAVNIASPTQLLKWFESKGVKLSTTRESVLTELSVKHKGKVVGDVCDILLEDRGAAKFLSTYINSFLGKSRNEITGRIHPDWAQASTSTGRMACRTPNLMNIPGGPIQSRIRNAFVASPGFKLIIVDYSQFETRVLAELSGENKMITVFQEGHKVDQEYKAFCKTHNIPSDIAGWKTSDKAGKKEQYAQYCKLHPHLDELVIKIAECDFHTRTASLLFGVPPAEVNKDQRRYAKTITFAVPYGVGPPGIVEQSGLTLNEAEDLLSQYYSTYRSAKLYLDKSREQAKLGCTKTPAGRKRYYQPPNIQLLIRELEEQVGAHKVAVEIAFSTMEKAIQNMTVDNILIDQEGETLYHLPKLGWVSSEDWLAHLVRNTEWSKSIDTWHTEDVIEMAKKKVKYLLGEIERAGTNHPIQGFNADATKLASVLIGRRLREIDPRCCIILFVHDEVVVSVPEEIVDKATEIIEQSMIEAAQRWMVKVPVAVGTTVLSHWTK